LRLLVHFFACLLLTTCSGLNNRAPVPTLDSLDAGLKLARQDHKPVFLIFDWYGAPTPYVDHLLRDADLQQALQAYVVVRLMCDDQRPFNDTMSVGDFNADLQGQLTGAYYQPMFCLLDTSGHLKAPCLGYAPRPEVLALIRAAQRGF
jgi:hypothetical protein